MTYAYQGASEREDPVQQGEGNQGDRQDEHDGDDDWGDYHDHDEEDGDDEGYDGDDHNDEDLEHTHPQQFLGSGGPKAKRAAGAVSRA